MVWPSGMKLDSISIDQWIQYGTSDTQVQDSRVSCRRSHRRQRRGSGMKYPSWIQTCILLEKNDDLATERQEALDVVQLIWSTVGTVKGGGNMPSKSWASDRRDTVLIADALRFIECHLASSRVNSDLCLSASYMRAAKNSLRDSEPKCFQNQ